MNVYDTPTTVHPKSKEGQVVSIFFHLLHVNPEDIHIAANGEFDVDDEVAQFMLHSAFTLDREMYKVSL